MTRRRLFSTLIALIAVTTSACATSSASSVINLFDAQRQIERYLASGQYDADVARVAAAAQAYMARRAPHVQRPAIVLDIDETALSNWPAYRVNGWVRVLNGDCNLDVGPCGLRAWQALARSDALKPTLELATRAKALGVAVLFITGRPANLREATEQNLREQGYQWEELSLAPNGVTFRDYSRSYCRTKGFAGEPHSDQRESRIRGEWRPTFSCAVIAWGQSSGSLHVLRGHPVTACLAQSSYAASTRALRAESSIVSCFHMAYSTCDSFLASAMMAICAPRRCATCLAFGQPLNAQIMHW